MNFFDICVQVGSCTFTLSSSGHRLSVIHDCGYSAVLTCIHNLCLGQNYEKSQQFQLKIVIFTAVKYRCLLQGNVCVM